MYKIVNQLERILLSRYTFFIFSICLVAYIIVGQFNLYSRGGSDYWEHLAVIYHFSLDPTDSQNPFLPTSIPFFLNTPYHLFWGLVSRIINVHPFWLLPLIGAINITIFLIGTVFLSKFLTNSKKYSLIIALTLLFFWYKPWFWSGFYNFGLLPLTIIYPYWFAFPLSLIIISRFGKHNGNIDLFIYTLLLAIVFLIHPLTGSFLFLSIIIKTITKANIPNNERIKMLFLPVLAFFLSMLWPYFSVSDAIFNISRERHFLGKYWIFYVQPWKTFLPALLGLLYIYFALRTKKYNFVVIGLMAATAIYIINRFTIHNQYLSRYLIFISFFLQVSVVMLLKNAKYGLLRNIIFTIYIIFLLIFGIKQIQLSSTNLGFVVDIKTDSPLGTHSNINIYNQYKPISEYISHKDVIFASIYESWMLPGILGCYIVASPHSEIFEMDDEYKKRWDDTQLFFHESTTQCIREEIMSKYDMQFVIVNKDLDYSNFDSLKTLKMVFFNDELKLYEVKGEK